MNPAGNRVLGVEVQYLSMYATRSDSAATKLVTVDRSDSSQVTTVWVGSMEFFQLLNCVA